MDSNTGMRAAAQRSDLVNDYYANCVVVVLSGTGTLQVHYGVHNYRVPGKLFAVSYGIRIMETLEGWQIITRPGTTAV